jgi:hypothetical protein
MDVVTLPPWGESHPKLCTRARGCLHPLALFLLRKLTFALQYAAEALSPRGEGSRRRLRGRSPHLRGTSRNRARFPHLFSESSGRVSCFGRSASRSARDNWQVGVFAQSETGRYDPILPPRESRQRKAIESRRRPKIRADKQEEGCSRPAFARRCSTGLVFESRGIIAASNYNPARNILRKMARSRGMFSRAA